MTLGTIGCHSTEAIEASLQGSGIVLEIGSFLCRVTSDTRKLSKPLSQLYAAYRCSFETLSEPVDFHLNLKRIGRFRDSEAELLWEGTSPFPRLPISQAHPLFEWGLNWAIATLSGSQIVVHSAVVERNGSALMLPGEPGSGKSTLCASLALSNWRLLSDELTIIDPHTLLAQPLPRPISLKDGSINIIRERHPGTLITRPITETRKGSIAYAKPADEAVHALGKPVPVKLIVFPKFSAGASFGVTPLNRAYTLARLLQNTFNVGLLGKEGFLRAAAVVSGAKGFEISYGNLDDVHRWLEEDHTT